MSSRIEKTVCWKCFIPVGCFAILYIVGIALPLEITGHYHNYMSRIWNWTEIAILLLSVYYIIKPELFTELPDGAQVLNCYVSP